MKKQLHVKNKLGFGCMRLPTQGEQVDHAAFAQMVDVFLSSGFNYFDTACGYMNGQSESALRECLTSRHPRESFILTDKLTDHLFSKHEEIRPLFFRQLQNCGVDYFDLYLMHAQDESIFAKYKKCRAYETALELLAEGRIKHFGISFHDKAEVLEQILAQYPRIEVVQIQFNYMDYDDPSIESRKCYEVCRKFGKDVIIMEPVKGGCLASLPPTAQQVFDELGSASSASYALRFAAGFDGVLTVLSGMGSMEMLQDNIATFQNLSPLNNTEQAAVQKVCSILRTQDLIPCTDCRYCIDHCPQNIAIPNLFACMNAKKQWNNWNADYYYNNVHTRHGRRASSCIQCGQCETVCPQHLAIPKLLADVAAEFER